MVDTGRAACKTMAGSSAAVRLDAHGLCAYAMHMARHVSDPPRPFRDFGQAAPGGGSAPSKRSRKRAASVGIDADIPTQAKEMNLNLSQTLENALRAKLREEQIRKFEEEHREAFESYNRFVAEHGLWGEEFRNW
jgi:antitoxin CcdA